MRAWGFVSPQVVGNRIWKLQKERGFYIDSFYCVSFVLLLRSEPKLGKVHVMDVWFCCFFLLPIVLSPFGFLVAPAASVNRGELLRFPWQCHTPLIFMLITVWLWDHTEVSLMPCGRWPAAIFLLYTSAALILQKSSLVKIKVHLSSVMRRQVWNSESALSYVSRTIQGLKYYGW